MKRVCKYRLLGISAKRRLYEGVVVPTAPYRVETRDMRAAERRTLNVKEMRCLESMCGVTRIDWVKNDEVRRRTGGLKNIRRSGGLGMYKRWKKSV